VSFAKCGMPDVGGWGGGSGPAGQGFRMDVFRIIIHSSSFLCSCYAGSLQDLNLVWGRAEQRPGPGRNRRRVREGARRVRREERATNPSTNERTTETGAATGHPPRTNHAARGWVGCEFTDGGDRWHQSATLDLDPCTACTRNSRTVESLPESVAGPGPDLRRGAPPVSVFFR